MSFDAVDLLGELVGIDSQNPGVGEAAIAAFVRDRAVGAGFDVDVVETAPGRCNVIATVDAGGGPCLALAGHLDTKPIGDTTEWRTPPLALTVEGDLAYGLGTSDMKGAVGAMLEAAERWATRADGGRLVLVFTADEEAGSEYGAKALAASRRVAADALVIGEPSGIERPWEALHLVSRGICCFDVVLEGMQGHSGLSERLPTSATVAAGHAVVALADLEPDFPPHPEYHYRPTVNAGVRLSGGVFYGVHPGRAEVACDIRLVPGMTRERLDEQVRACLVAAVPSDVRWTIRYREDALGWMEPVSVPPDARVVAAAQEACTEVLGAPLPLGAYPGGTDATAFATLGFPCVASLGPGWLSVAHGPNEHVGLSQVRQAVGIYEHLATAFCAPPGAR